MTGQLHKAQFAVWVSSHCPRLLEGVQHWMLSLLHGHHEHHHEAASVRAQGLFSEGWAYIKIRSIIAQGLFIEVWAYRSRDSRSSMDPMSTSMRWPV